MSDPTPLGDFPLHGSRDDMERWLNQRAAADPAFRHALLTDPRATLAAVVGKPPPKSLKLSVVAEPPDQLVLVQRFAGATPAGAAASASDRRTQLVQALGRAAAQPGFAKSLAEQPAAALAKHVGLAVAPGVSVRVLAEAHDEAVLVLYDPTHLAAWTPPAVAKAP